MAKTTTTMKASIIFSVTAFFVNHVNGFNGILTNSFRRSVILDMASRSNCCVAVLVSPSSVSSNASIAIGALKRSASIALSLSAAIALSFTIGTVPPAIAVSGGGLDYANIDLSGKDFSNGNYKGKDFTQVIAKGTTFENSNLVGCRFYKAFLVNANFKNADLRGASLEDTSMEGAVLDNANAAGAYFSASLLEVKSMTGADFTDAQLPPKLLARICEKANFAAGTNSATGIETRESLMCP